MHFLFILIRDFPWFFLSVLRQMLGYNHETSTGYSPHSQRSSGNMTHHKSICQPTWMNHSGFKPQIYMQPNPHSEGLFAVNSRSRYCDQVKAFSQNRQSTSISTTAYGVPFHKQAMYVVGTNDLKLQSKIYVTCLHTTVKYGIIWSKICLTGKRFLL